MEVKVEVKLTTKELFNFMMYHTYSSFSGYIGILLSVLALLALVYSWNTPAVGILQKSILFLTGILFTVIQPCMLYLKSKKQVKMSESINKPLLYQINGEGITISQDEQKVKTKWDEVIKVTNTKLSVILYVSRVRAFILPKSAIEEQMEDLKNLIRTNAKASYIKLR